MHIFCYTPVVVESSDRHHAITSDLQSLLRASFASLITIAALLGMSGTARALSSASLCLLCAYSGNRAELFALAGCLLFVRLKEAAVQIKLLRSQISVEILSIKRRSLSGAVGSIVQLLRLRLTPFLNYGTKVLH
jgi:hypothetical protein